MEEPDELRAWLRKAFDYVATLPPKVRNTAQKPVSTTVGRRKDEKMADKRRRSVPSLRPARLQALMAAPGGARLGHDVWVRLAELTGTLSFAADAGAGLSGPGGR
jgi:hypothetical protein